MDQRSSKDVGEEQPTTGVEQDSDQSRYLYRVCRKGEDPTKGIEARNPNKNDVTPTSHVHGQHNSPFISTSSTFDAAKEFYQTVLKRGEIPGPVVRIDRECLSREPGIQIIDLCDPEVVDKEFKINDKRGRNYASKYKEVLVKGRIPPAHCINVESSVFDSQSSEADANRKKNDPPSEELKRRNPNEKGDVPTAKKSEAACNNPHADEKILTQNLTTLSEEYIEALESFITRRGGTVEMLESIVSQLNACSVKANNANISGAVTSIVGAGASLLSIPLTGGLSAFAMAAGTLMGVVGGVTKLSGQIYGDIRESDLMKKAEKILQDDQAEAESLAKMFDTLQGHLEIMKQMKAEFISRFPLAEILLVTAQVAKKGTAEMAKVGAAQIAKAATSQMAKVGTSQIAYVVPARIAKVGTSQIASVVPSQIAKAGTLQITKVVPSQITKVGTSQIIKAGTVQMTMGGTAQMTMGGTSIQIFPSHIVKIVPAQMAKTGTSQTAKVGTTQIAKHANAVVSVIFIPIEVWQIVNSLKELSQDNSEKALQLNETIKLLKADMKEKQDLRDYLISSD